ncbi:hypothetical protein LLH00_16240 [bacterium]|nr:hypothetical protein [bacterium]
MPRGKGIDKAKLYKLVKAGKSAQSIMAELGIKNKAALKLALADVMIEKGEVLQVAGMSARATGNRKLTKMGLIIPRAQLEPQFKQGDQFEMSIEGGTITLTKV